MNLLKKRGRPRVGSGKNERLHIRMPEGYNNKIEYLMKVRARTKTEVVLDAIDAQYKLELFRHD